MAGNGVSGHGQLSGIEVAQQWPALPVNAHLWASFGCSEEDSVRV